MRWSGWGQERSRGAYGPGTGWGEGPMGGEGVAGISAEVGEVVRIHGSWHPFIWRNCWSYHLHMGLRQQKRT